MPDKDNFNAVLEPRCAAIAIEGNGSRPSHRGDGYSEQDAMYTLNATEVHAVAFAQNTRDEVRDLHDKSGCLSSALGTKQQTYLAYALDCRNADVSEELSGTLQAKPNGGDSHNSINPVAVESDDPIALETYHLSHSDTTAPGLKARDYKDPLCVAETAVYDMTHADEVVRECGNTVPTLQSRMGTGGNQVPLIVRKTVRWIVRRLMPIEAERLQMFPDNWTDLGEWVDSKGKKHKDSDTPRYKALGNSICTPYWFWLMRRMAAYLPEDATLGSLFDGIGGFPLCWEMIHGKGTARWASEIEEFPIAVTKLRFPEEVR